MKLLKLFSVTALAITLLSGCGSSKVELNEKTVELPGWFATPPQSQDHLYGTALADSKNVMTAIDKAKHEATVDLSAKLEQRIKGLIKRFKQEIGDGLDATDAALFESATKSVINTTINGVQVNKQEVKQNMDTKLYRAYVLVEMPIGTANKALMQKLSEQKALYTKIESTRAFKELDAELAK